MRRVSKDAAPRVPGLPGSRNRNGGASWFETDCFAILLTMRVIAQ
jgi:hypothetical protein